MRIALVLLACAVAAFGFSAPASARGKSQSGVAKTLASAQKKLKRVPKKSFARGKANAIQRSLTSSRKSLQRRRTCPAIVALDSGHNLLLDPHTWRKAVPKVVKRSIAPALDRAERKLVSSAKGCALSSFKLSTGTSTRTGGSGFQPVPVPLADR